MWSWVRRRRRMGVWVCGSIYISVYDRKTERERVTESRCGLSPAPCIREKSFWPVIHRQLVLEAKGNPWERETTTGRWWWEVQEWQRGGETHTQRKTKAEDKRWERLEERGKGWETIKSGAEVGEWKVRGRRMIQNEEDRSRCQSYTVFTRVLLSMNYSFCFSFHQVCRYKTATKGQTATITMLLNHTWNLPQMGNTLKKDL